MEPHDDEGGQTTPQDIAYLRVAAEQYRHSPELLWTHLHAVLHKEDLLSRLAADSAFHPNGFIKIALLPEESPRVRLHVWPLRARDRFVSPHGHRWPFASWIITGSLRETTYIEGPRGQVFDVWGYNGVDSGELQPLRTCRLARQRTARHEEGQVYARDRQEVHDAYPVGDGIVASLVVQGPVAGEHTPVYRPPGDPELLRNSPITPAELKPLLDQVAKTLQPVA